MDLAEIVNKEFTEPLKGAIVADDLIATSQLIESVKQVYSRTENSQTVEVFAESYILDLKNGTQKNNEVTIDDIQTWIQAKGLEATLDANAVYNSILKNGTSWDKIGGSRELQAIINENNIQRVIDVAVENELNKILNTQWL